jgi:chemotaxis protein histidine kinase CheA
MLMEIFQEVFPDVSIFLKERFSEANSLAVRLGKEKPIINIETEPLLMLPDAVAALDAAIPHIIGNAMDHGIEAASERLMNGKSLAGKLAVKVWCEGDLVKLIITDDGRGLDFEKLRNKAKEIFGDEVASVMGQNELKEVLFKSGISTKEQLTDISGRGVGMGAARDAIRASGGEMSIRICNESGLKKGVKFDIQIDLPAGLFLKQGGDRSAA